MSEKELKDIYDNGFTLEFNNDSKIVLISDVHRGDGTYADSLLPNRNIYITALKYYLKNNYTYIEVGDGDELWKNKNFILHLLPLFVGKAFERIEVGFEILHDGLAATSTSALSQSSFM